MGTERMTAPATWGTSPAITAAVDTAVLVRNTTTRNMFFAITASDTPPAFEEGQGHRILPSWSSDSDVGLSLATGERLWLVMPAGASDVTVTTGAA